MDSQDDAIASMQPSAFQSQFCSHVDGPPRRTVIHGEAMQWLDSNPAGPGHSVITSLPDVSELPAFDFDEWRAWFVAAARRVIRWLPKDGVAIFFQSDVRVEGTWIDKGYLIMKAAEAEGASLLWHKIVCRSAPGTIAPGRPAYSHMICVAPESRPPAVRPGPDVLADAGFKPWPRAMGEQACRVACRFLREETKTSVIVDPFCGEGSVLAVANAMGFDAVGIDLSRKRCRAAAAQQLDGRAYK